MLLAAVACVLVPLWRSRARLTTVVAMAAALSVTALLLYAVLGAPGRQKPGDLPSVEQMVASLEARMVNEPRNIDGWVMLGRSYVVMQRFSDAAQAYGRAYELTNGQDVDIVTSYAEALVLSDSTALEGRAAPLFDAALEVAPNNVKALWYGGLSSYVRGNLGVARNRWSRLRALGPPPEVDDLLVERIAELDRRLGSESANVAEASPEESRTPASSGIEVRVTLNPELSGQLDPRAPLFIIAREPARAGPPVAVARRSAAELPLSLRLTDADAMLPGRKLSDFDDLELVARVALGGQPLPASGDLFGEADYRSGQDGPIELTIDRVVP